MRGLMVAGATSGVGKTTIAVGLIGALKRRGLRVQPFKAGPDYIDPTYHSRAAGAPSRNLDTWLVPRQGVLELFRRAMARKDVAVVEGVMGLFDGRSPMSDEGSGAELAKLLGLPVLLVVDASAVARSIAATVLGFQRFDPDVRIAGVVLNRVGGPGHAELCRQAIESATGAPVVGALQLQADLALPERHLGLVPTMEGATADAVFDRIVHAIEAGLDLERIVALSEIPAPPAGEASLFPAGPVAAQARIAVAMDRAFSFYYQDSLDLLEAWGAELAPFSPLEDGKLPPRTTGVYIGGGFPELYAKGLADNKKLLEALRAACLRGVPIYGECGGLMYLGESITDFDGVKHPMTGLVPARSRLAGSRLTLGYRTVRALSDGPVLRAGQEARGHEFHWSSLEGAAPVEAPAYVVPDESGRREGFCRGSVLASYVHLHLASDPRLAPQFVAACRSAREAVR